MGKDGHDSHRQSLELCAGPESGTVYARRMSQKMPPQEMFEQGLEKRRAVMGAEFVDRAFAGGEDAFGADFQRFMTEYAWGAVWGRGGLTDRERHMVTIGILAALGREKELAGHLRATANTGVSERDLSDVLHQVAIYAGVPAALSAVNATKEMLAKRHSKEPNK
ncbi:4-carboxymuconolactone decarboxylase [Deinococcus radiodurans R1 = ATCC 13939 = DSM 20539]|uniref:4-carboxymuconolactone decarboxylase n=2 Tax=Deinococcus radiodurans TaxID=1299 RepID=Q9RV26_DEIRA|nr:4-carboxymuconolactone decarboxylase [Deinococcus radiodurans R1 = ATCC 13939 = DSM 20539]QEM72746.1 4-carboxymuconolactone decarboxylase [Deinococcus radiodurans]UDL00334.1 4-carboxymuconolactone decarboxylase [Deinococcus radiodurans R1 = ATCC 13939 = DSM 20539]HCE64356.1 4-carboxymuconolactone decarboxylase [Deinococcus radiodurans]